MAVIYLPKDDRFASAAQGALDTYIKTKMYSDDKNQKEAAYKLQTLLELGGQTNELEIGSLEQALKLQPGQLKGVAQTDPSTGLMKIPGRLERESKSALGAYEQKSVIDERQAALNAPAQTARKVAEIGALGPAQTLQKVVEIQKIGPEQTKIDVEKAKQLGKVKSDETISLLKEQDLLTMELANKNLPEIIRMDKEKQLAANKTKIAINLENAKSDPLVKQAIEKGTAEIAKIKAETLESEAKATWFGSAAKTESKTDLVKMNEVNEYLVQVGAATKDDKGKIRPKELDVNDPIIKQVIDTLTEQGFKAETVPTTPSALRSVLSPAISATTGTVTISVAPGKISKIGSATGPVRIGPVKLTPIQDEAFKKLKGVPAFAKFTDEQIQEYVKKNY